jgi:hypothetical protein
MRLARQLPRCREIVVDEARAAIALRRGDAIMQANRRASSS